VRPGDHATTFGGGPLVATVARAVLATLADPVFLEGVRERGRRLEAGLRGLVDRHAHVRAVRGRGLLLGLVLDAPAAPVISAALDAGLLVCAAGPEVVRLLPPLNIEPALLDEGVAILDEVLMTAAPS
jgi:acetylornithine/succinyldiaminopimelate/putrescine aminotransferase